MLKIILPTGWRDIYWSYWHICLNCRSSFRSYLQHTAVLHQTEWGYHSFGLGIQLQIHRSYYNDSKSPMLPNHRPLHTQHQFLKLLFLVCLLESRIFHLLFPFWKFCYAPYYYNQTRASMANLHEMFFLSYSFRIFLFLNQYFTNFSTDYHAVIKPGMNHFSA